MNSITFDTHKFIQRLQSAGFRTEQAEAVADAFRDAQGEGEFATKRDIERLESGLIALEHRMTIELGGLMVVAVGAVATLTKLI